MHRMAREGVVLGIAVLVGIVARVAVTTGQTPEVSASGAWVKLPAPGETRTTAFLDIENPTMYDVYLTSATADVAGKAEYREAGPGGVAKPDALKSVTV